MEPWAKAVIVNLENEILVSAVSVFEIGIKVRAGKLPESVGFEINILENIDRLGFTVLALSPEVMMRAARFPSEHKDTFDRMIAAQAIDLDVALLSVDAEMETFGVRRLRAPSA